MHGISQPEEDEPADQAAAVCQVTDDNDHSFYDNMCIRCNASEIGLLEA